MYVYICLGWVDLNEFFFLNLCEFHRNDLLCKPQSCLIYFAYLLNIFGSSVK